MDTTTLPNARSETESNGRSSEAKRKEALSVHANTENILRVVFKVADPHSGPPHRYYRAILRAPNGRVHLAGGHVRVARGDKYVEDPSAGSESPFWVDRGVDLESALREVNGFVPKHQSADTYVATRFLEGRRQCLTLWQAMKDKGL